MPKQIIRIFVILIILISTVFYFTFLNKNKQNNIYQGHLEAVSIKLLAKTSGEIVALKFEEGDQVKKNQELAQIDTKYLKLQIEQKNIQLKSLDLNLTAMKDQISQLKTQLEFKQTLLKKTTKLVAQNAATTQQKDELNTQVNILASQYKEINTRYAAAQNDGQQLQKGLQLLEFQLSDSKIISPIDGIITNKFFQQHELIAQGMSIGEVADLKNLEAKIYLPVDQLSSVKIAQEVKIKIDGEKNSFAGKIIWIASEAEFTPKTILTKETRTSLVYAVKIKIPNPEEKLKIGMPIEVEL